MRRPCSHAHARWADCYFARMAADSESMLITKALLQHVQQMRGLTSCGTRLVNVRNKAPESACNKAAPGETC